MYLVNGYDHANQWRSKNLNQNENIPQYDIKCVVGRKSDGTKSSITKCVILVIHVDNWIRSIDQKSVSQKKKCDDI